MIKQIYLHFSPVFVVEWKRTQTLVLSFISICLAVTIKSNVLIYNTIVKWSFINKQMFAVPFHISIIPLFICALNSSVILALIFTNCLRWKSYGYCPPIQSLPSLCDVANHVFLLLVSSLLGHWGTTFLTFLQVSDCGLISHSFPLLPVLNASISRNSILFSCSLIYFLNNDINSDY